MSFIMQNPILLPDILFQIFAQVRDTHYPFNIQMESGELRVVTFRGTMYNSILVCNTWYTLLKPALWSTVEDIFPLAGLMYNQPLRICSTVLQSSALNLTILN